MTTLGDQTATGRCGQCDVAIEVCAFCESEECRVPLCYRCVRIGLAQEVRQPHLHGG